MTFEAETLAILTGYEPLEAITGERVYASTAPQNPHLPFIVFRRISTDPTHSTDNGEPGSFELDNIRLEVSCHARSAQEANSIAKLARRALEANRPTVYLLQDQIYDYSDLPDAYQTLLEFSCWFQDQVPS